MDWIQTNKQTDKQTDKPNLYIDDIIVFNELLINFVVKDICLFLYIFLLNFNDVISITRRTELGFKLGFYK